MEYIDLRAQYQSLKEEIDLGISEVLNNAEFILGNKVIQLESELAKYVGVKHAITCSDGTAALQLVYMAYGIGKGDAVFWPDMTFIASIEPACLLGATSVFCEIDADSYNIDVNSFERQIKNVISEGKYTPKAVVAVDFLGNPADFDAIKTVADKYNLLVIEDAAQAMGASYRGKKCGSLGDIAATSFFPSKPLGCYGDGGAVFTDNDEIADIIRSLRVHGKGIDKYHNVRIGINSRLDSIQAAVLLPKLHKLEQEIGIRQEKAGFYNTNVGQGIKCPVISDGSISSYAQYVILAKDSEHRQSLQDRLKEANVPTIRYYPVPMHKLPVFANINTYGESYEITDAYADRSFGIPFSAYIRSEDQNTIVGILNGV